MNYYITTIGYLQWEIFLGNKKTEKSKYIYELLYLNFHYSKRHAVFLIYIVFAQLFRMGFI